MKPGDIVLIRFPQADLKSGKLRPALIIAISPSRLFGNCYANN
jgi:mRNA interferase MazF